MIKDIIWALVLYLLYKFIFELIIPMAKATNTMRNKIQEMQNEQKRQSEMNNTINQQQSNKTKPEAGEYIDFEEVKLGMLNG
ncbi:MAG: hypothetical protein LBE82_05900 [Chitinophagaceae bacterium]|jgi:predicted Holliday junction resolvase-like endonuclease|nr:hypothetical protein [Chitinophagaceae bacterium]